MPRFNELMIISEDLEVLIFMEDPLFFPVDPHKPVYIF